MLWGNANCPTDDEECLYSFELSSYLQACKSFHVCQTNLFAECIRISLLLACFRSVGWSKVHQKCATTAAAVVDLMNTNIWIWIIFPLLVDFSFNVDWLTGWWTEFSLLSDYKREPSLKERFDSPQKKGNTRTRVSPNRDRTEKISFKPIRNLNEHEIWILFASLFVAEINSNLNSNIIIFWMIRGCGQIDRIPFIFPLPSCSF